MKNDVLQEPRPTRQGRGWMRDKLWKIILVLILLGGGAAFWFFKAKGTAVPVETRREVSPHRGSIQSVISTTGTVLPKNRLEIKPPVNGRIESVEVKEGESVKIGQIVAWMSSTDRAALLDNARGQGEKALKYWQDAYKPIPLLAPIDGEVIVATTQPGQTVTTSDSVIVLSDHLIVRAQVDETDIGKVKVGQKAVITLDAYPGQKINAKVEHIYYESTTVNNVTIYNVDLTLEDVPAFFRSGMNTNVDFVVESKDNALLIPSEAVHQEKGKSYVLLSQGAGREPEMRHLKIGLSDDKNTEVLSGLEEDDVVLMSAKKFSLPKSGATGTNPFMPARRH